MKIIIYKHFINQKGILERPIDVLIIVDQVNISMELDQIRMCLFYRKMDLHYWNNIVLGK